MSDKALRPSFVLAFPGDTQGCGFHRVIFPLGALASAGLVDARIDMGVWTEDQFRACAPDVIVWQRPTEEMQIEAVAIARKACPNAFFIYELDDRLDVVPEASYHAGYIPKQEVVERVRRGLLLCDAASVTTELMAEWLRGLGATDVRIIPNLLPLARVAPRKQHAPDRRLRIGWGGGVSHAGDLALIEPAIAQIGADKVDWVFLAAKPNNLSGVQVEFHDGVPPPEYLEKLRTLDLDLILAPLEDNEFNRAKSNLRLVEAGAIGAATIAQMVTPYLENDPPVFAYATTPEQWTAAIRRFIDTSLAERNKAAEMLQAWVGRFYTFETRLQERYQAWLPQTGQHWRPAPAKSQTEQVVIAAPGGKASIELPHSLRYARIETDLDAACRRAAELGADVLYLRPATTLEQPAWEALRNGFAQGVEVGGVLPLAPDGPNAFPRREAFAAVATPMGRILNEIVGERFVGKFLFVNVLGGPAMLLHRNALAMVGAPDVAGCGGPEEAILEWGLRAMTRGWRFLQAASSYVSTMQAPPSAQPHFGARIQARGAAGIAVQMPVEEMPVPDREALELALFNRMWTGPQPGLMGFPNDYASWAKLRPQPIELLRHVPCGRIDVRQFGDAVGDLEWVVFVDDSVTLKPHALWRFLEKINEVDEKIDLIYADHEVKIGDTLVPDFKPDLDTELLLARDYITPMVAIRWASAFGEQYRDTYDDRQDLYIDILSRATTVNTIHLPEILATVERSGTPEEAAVVAMGNLEAVKSIFSPGEADIEVHRGILGAIQVKRRWQFYRNAPPLVSVIMPTRGGAWLLQPAIGTLLKLTNYPNFEVIVVHNGDTDAPDLGDAANDPRVRWFKWPHPYHWSVLNNVAVRDYANGELLCFMNDDVRVVGQDWLDLMVAQALRDDVGAVGAKLIYPNNTVQHVGVITHRGVMGHLHKGMPVQQPGYWGIAGLSHENSAVTAAVMVTRRDVFDSVGGFDERLSHNYNDVVFCLELRKRHLRNIVECNAILIHAEGSTRPSPFSTIGGDKLRAENAFVAEHYNAPDPYWNPNFALTLSMGGLMLQGLNCEMLVWPDRVPDPTAERVLLINDKLGFEGSAFAEAQAGHIPLMADLSGFQLRLMSPAPANSAGWDIRDARRLREALALLGVTRIVLRSLVGQHGAAPPVETLRGLHQVGIKVTLDPLDPLYLCPWQDTSGRVIDETRFGGVDTEAWRQAWISLEAA